MEKEIVYRPIGVVRSPFKEARGTPIQPEAAEGVRAEAVVYKEYAEGLKDLDGFSHIILLFHFHLSSQYSLKVKPYMDDEVHGVFATRAPRRPNSIGLSVVKLAGISGNILHIEDVDIIDGTPLLDIKPYVPDFDIRSVERIGWLKDKITRLPDTKDDGRFIG